MVKMADLITPIPSAFPYVVVSMTLGNKAGRERRARGGLNLVVIRATDAERAAHEAILEKMRDSTTPVWDRLDGD